MKYFFEIDGYSLREVLPKNTMKLILLDLHAIAKNSIESIRIESRKTNPDLVSINEWERELMFVYKTCLGLFEDFMSFTSSAGKISKFISDEDKIINRDDLFIEINILVEKFLINENVS